MNGVYIKDEQGWLSMHLWASHDSVWHWQLLALIMQSYI